MRLELTRLLRPAIAVVTSAALVVSCASRIWPSDVGVRKGDWVEGGHQGNWARSERNRTFEWPYNHPSRRHGEPGLCVAFSGGGLRSASFAIGVLDGLGERHVLREIDRASSVSGGGYALSWYFAHHYDAWKRAKTEGGVYDANAFDRELFAEGGVYQEQLEGGMDIVTNPFKTGSFGVSTGQALTALLATVPFAGVNLLVNGMFGWHANTSPLRRFYQSRIERVFHHTPGSFTSLGFFDLGRRDEIAFADLRRMLRKTRAAEGTHLPFPIFVAAANLNHTSGSAALDVANRLFEMTPKWIGSDAFGYHRERPLDLHQATAVSGAALDSRVALAGPPSVFASILDMDLGFHIDNPIFAGNRFGYWASPFPVYFWTGWQNDQEGARIHLTDGGHAENLGAFPLFRRLCRQTLIVDGTYDPNLGFDDYRVLREALRAELELKLEIGAIDEWVVLQAAVARILRTLTQGEPSDLDRGRRVIDDLALLHPAWVPRIRASYDPDDLESDGWKRALPAVKEAIVAHLDDLRKNRGYRVPKFRELTPDMAWLLLGPGPISVKKGEQWSRVLEAEVLEGTVRGLKRPQGGSAQEEDAPLQVFYLKLNFPRSVRLDPSTCSGEEWGKDACTYRKAGERDFPQEKTEDLSFEREQFRAYRALGQKMGERFCLRADGEVPGWWSAPGQPWSLRPLSTACPAD